LGSRRELHAHRPDGRVETLHCPYERGCAFPQAAFTSVAVSGGVDVDGRLHLNGEFRLPQPSPARWHLISQSTSPAAMDTLHRVHHWRDEVVPLSLASPPRTLVDVNYIGERTVAVLSEDGTITWDGGGQWTREFRDPPYEMLRASNFMACAQRAVDDGIECLDGREFSWGPLLDLMVMESPLSGDDAIICGLTVDHRIRCDEETTPPDLLEHFELLNAALDLQDRLAGVPVW
jgi:hypothetical protein